MTVLLYEEMYRRFGVRKLAHLQTPRYGRFEQLALPRNSVYFYHAESELEDGPALDNVFLKNIHRPIPMIHITELTEQYGAPRHHSIMLNDTIRKYHLRNKKYRLARDVATATRDPSVPFVVNLSLMQRRYKYIRNVYTEYNRWYNGWATTVSSMQNILKETPRQLFVEMTLPTKLPPIATLRVAEEEFKAGIVEWDLAHNSPSVGLEALLDTELDVNGQRLSLEAITQGVLKHLDGPHAFLIAELWKWLGEKRPDSVLTQLTGYYDRVNLIIRNGLYWTVLNLGKLDSWRNTPDKEVITVPELEDNSGTRKALEVNKDGLSARDLRVRFIKFVMHIYALGTQAGTTAVDQAVATVSEQTVMAPDGKVETAIVMHDDGPVNETPVDVKQQAMDEATVEAEMAQLTQVTAQMATAPTEQVVDAPKTPEESILAKCNQLAEEGSISAAEFAKFQKLAANYHHIQTTDGAGKPIKLGELAQVPKHLLTLEKKPIYKKPADVFDVSMAHSSLESIDRDYVKHVLHRDVASMVTAIQHAGVLVTDYQVERQESIMGDSDNFTIRLQPIVGKPSTLSFKLPVVNEDGVYTANSVKYSMRAQRGDLPIRKVKPDKVALTSYYGKVFVVRSEENKYNYSDWLNNSLVIANEDMAHTQVVDAIPAIAFDNQFQAPRVYSILSKSFREITLGGWRFQLDHRLREELFGKDLMTKYEKDGSVLCATRADGAVMVMDKVGGLYALQHGKLTALPSIEELAGLDEWKRPLEYTYLSLTKAKLPVGIILAYYYGYDELLKTLKVQPRIVPVGTRGGGMSSGEFRIDFADEYHIFHRDDPKVEMLLGGFARFSDITKQYQSHEFNKKNVYLALIEGIRGGTVRHIREIDIFEKLFIDPITLGLLEEMGEPTTVKGLLIRATELLQTEYHQDEMDGSFMRFKRYERLAGAVYSQMVAAVKAQAARGDQSRVPIDMNPYAVWKTIAQDSALAIVEEINPVQNIKEKEAVTYNGFGGRSAQTMNRSTRVYHKNDLGVISEATVDSADVGINIYMSANPNLTSLRGTSATKDAKDIQPSELFSTAAMLSPFADRDDAKRTTFIGIQMRHTVPCMGYEAYPIRTGYEKIIGQRTSDLFSATAKQDGKVISISDDGMVVEYADGERKGIELGRRYGEASGQTIPHRVKTDLQVGHKFKANDLLAYNEAFFSPDPFDSSVPVWKSGAIATVVLGESPLTFEDSSGVSQDFAKKLVTQSTKVKQVVLNFSQEIHKLAAPHTHLDAEDILCVIEDAVTAESKLFTEESLETLKLLSSNAPKAKFAGMLERIEVFYHGDKEDMSPSVKQLVEYSDKQLAKRRGAKGMKRLTGSVDEGFRVDGNPLLLDTLCINFYITGDMGVGTGDKLVFANQMKSVVGKVLTASMTTTSGIKIDAFFGQKSIDDRIVNSPELMGTTTILLEQIAKQTADLYFG